MHKIRNLLSVPRLQSYDLSGLRTVISFSLYGNVEKYIGGLLKNCNQINQIYPHFWIYIYLGADVDQPTIDGKFDTFKNVVLINTGASGHEVASHRFFSIDRQEVGISFSRDADSEINERDQYCINRFIQSMYGVQVIRDHPMHGIEMLAGMWGIKKGVLSLSIRDMFTKFKSERSTFQFYDDQHFLTQYIYPRVRLYTLAFDSRFTYPDAKKVSIPLPIRRDENGADHFVGSPIYLY